MRRSTGQNQRQSPPSRNHAIKLQKRLLLEMLKKALHHSSVDCSMPEERDASEFRSTAFMRKFVPLSERTFTKSRLLPLPRSGIIQLTVNLVIEVYDGSFRFGRDSFAQRLSAKRQTAYCADEKEASPAGAHNKRKGRNGCR